MKKLVSSMIIVSMLALTLACAPEADVEEKTTTIEEVTTTEDSSTIVESTTSDENEAGGQSVYSKYITLGDYTGLEITAIDEEVTDDELEAELSLMFKECVEVGDIINLDFIGYINGETFEGGSTEGAGYDLEIGSGAFIDGFEDGLVGAKVGETVSLNLTFPENYDEEYAGKAVVFECTINFIYGVEAPALTIDYVKENTSYTTVEEYKEAVRADLLRVKIANAETEQYTEVLDKLLAICEVVEYPTDLYDKYYEGAVAYFDALILEYNYYYYMYNGATLSNEDMLALLGYTQEALDASYVSMANENAKLAMILSDIADREDITLSDEEFNEMLTYYMSEAGCETADEFYSSYGYTEETLRENLLYDEVVDFIIENAVMVSATE